MVFQARFKTINKLPFKHEARLLRSETCAAAFPFVHGLLSDVVPSGPSSQAATSELF